LKETGYAKSGDPIVVMAGSSSNLASVTDTVRMIIVP
jgi:hypothetical protein